MSFISSQITAGGIVMAADRCQIATKSASGLPSFTCALTAEKMFVTGNNIGILTYGRAEINKIPLSRYMYDFIWELDTEKYNTPYEVAQHIKDYFKKLDPKLDTLFHVGGYDMTDPKHPNPAVYQVCLEDNFFDKLNAHKKFEGACFCSADSFTGEIFKRMGGAYISHSLYDAIDFAKFTSDATRQMMRFQGGMQTIGKEVDILVIRPYGHELIKG